jgi:hypothetical protein
MSTISRRRLAAGVAWAVPVIVVGAAAPAQAASGCTPFTVESATALRSGVRLVLTSPNTNASSCITTFQTLVGSARLLDWGPLPSCLGTDSVTLFGQGTNNGNDFRGSYTVQYVVTTGTSSCTGTLTFNAIAPVP